MGLLVAVLSLIAEVIALVLFAIAGFSINRTVGFAVTGGGFFFVAISLDPPAWLVQKYRGKK